MDTITNSNGLLQSCEGPDAVEAFALRALIAALKLEAKGIKFRGRSMLAVAKLRTGLKSSKREIHIARLEIMMQNQLAKVLIVEAGLLYIIESVESGRFWVEGEGWSTTDRYHAATYSQADAESLAKTLRATAVPK